jgi:hypothetical protein
MQNMKEFDDAWRSLATGIGHAFGGPLFHQVRKKWITYEGTQTPGEFISQNWHESLEDELDRITEFDDEVDSDGIHDSPDQFMKKFNQKIFDDNQS